MNVVDKHLGTCDKIIPDGHYAETKPPILQQGEGWDLPTTDGSISSSPSKRRKVERPAYNSLLYQMLNCEEFCRKDSLLHGTKIQPNISNTTFGKFMHPNNGKNNAKLIKEIDTFVIPPRRIFHN